MPKQALIYNKGRHFTKLKTKLLIFSKILLKNTILITTFKSLINGAVSHASEKELKSDNESEHS